MVALWRGNTCYGLTGVFKELKEVNLSCEKRITWYCFTELKCFTDQRRHTCTVGREH